MYEPSRSVGITAADLAPGDGRAVRFDWTDAGVRILRSTEDADFEPAYAALWQAFGDQNELEPRDVLARRMAWRPETPTADGLAMRYDFAVVRQGGRIAAVADHTAVVDVRRPAAAVVVHVSHVLVMPAWRGSGLAGWVRAMPLATARECVRRAGVSARPVVLAGEMEHAAAGRPDGVGRLIAFEKAGFLKVDPLRVNYVQPDFRPPPQIDASGGPRPVPLSLVLRRVGREQETTITGGELAAVVGAIYAVYADGLREREMRSVRETMATYPSNDATVGLVAPTLVSTPVLSTGEG